ncbi:hypothetical protein CWE08_09270 [Aliidiomarina iranensis]|uniref:Putative glucose-6-phosphate 1-epimerase n=1 Tax=Aliidiomarina iranensis TaxID=1434071 RepID=A0A432VT68_9GAMM|nr:D-hexose-6-phosphate mutarotase [Aliidiomarina iranensis]RUO19612.1 hypothetical protein CWE08_09270 [Aliidiomarina iranensis]
MVQVSPGVIEIKHPRFTARVSVRGAQLLSFIPTGLRDLLWCTAPEFVDAALAKGNKPIRGGIPICWPWFAAHPERSDFPSHGFARFMDWKLVHSEDLGEYHQLVFKLRSCAATLVYWPHEFAATVIMKLGVSCSVQFHVKTQGEWTGALHTYLAVDDIYKVELEGLGDRYQDNLDGLVLKQADEVATLNRATEQMYVEPENVTRVKEPDFGTKELCHEGHTDIMLWTPWENAGNSPADMHAGDYKRMVCVETSRIQATQRTGMLSVRIEQR